MKIALTRFTYGFRIVSLFLAMLTAGIATADEPPGGPGDGNWIFGYPLEGVWTATVNLTTCGPSPIVLQTFQSMSLFAHGGTMQDANASPPVIQSPHFGVWKSLGGRRYSFAFRFFRFENGIPVGYNVVRHELLLSADGTSYTSSGTGEVYDMFGNRAFTGCSNATATRFE